VVLAPDHELEGLVAVFAVVFILKLLFGLGGEGHWQGVEVLAVKVVFLKFDSSTVGLCK